MGAEQPTDWQAAAISALEWWRDAGVDMLVEDAPRDWLAPVPRPTAPHPTAVPAADVAPAPAALPGTIAAFLEWRHGAGAPEAGWSSAWVAGHVPAQASEWMVLVDCPDREDAADGALLGGAAGRLFDRMLAAIGLSRDGVHIASVCAKRPIAGRLPPESADRLAEIARHHVALVAPKRLLVLGDAASRAILGTTVLEARENLRAFNHKSGEAGVVASFHPRLLIEQPMRKAQVWRDLRRYKGELGE